MASSTDHPRRGSQRAASRGDQPPAVRRRSRDRRSLRAVVLLVTVALTGCAATTGGPSGDTRVAVSPAGGVPGSGSPTGGAPGTARTTQGRAEAPPESAAPAPLPGLGPRTNAQIPDGTGQVLVVTGRARDANRSEVVLYRHTAAGWRPGPSWPARNALRGWTDDHRLGDLRSPIGVYGLTDAGGLLPDPGTRLPYYQDEGFGISGPGLEGESLEGAFDYVVAIDYNRVPGTSPLDLTRPLGTDKGGGIWLHVDHDGPTQGCVSLSEQHMRDLLRALDPALRPVIVMGDARSLLR